MTDSVKKKTFFCNTSNYVFIILVFFSCSGVDYISEVSDGPATDAFLQSEDVELMAAYEEVMGTSPEEDEEEDETGKDFDREEAFAVLQSARPKYDKTIMQKSVIEKIDIAMKAGEEVKQFCKRVHGVVSKSYAETVNVDKRNEHVAEFYTKCKNYLASSKYKSHVRSMFGTVSETEFHIGYAMFRTIRDKFLKDKSEEVICGVLEQENPRTELGDAARSKDRYVAGYCFRKLLESSTSKIKNNLFQKDRVSVVTEEYNKKGLINQALSRQRDIIKATVDQQSLAEILRKQNLREGLLNVSDNAYFFSIELCRKCLKLQTETNLHFYGKHLHHFVSAKLKSDADLFQKWCVVFTKPCSITDKPSGDHDVLRDCLESCLNSVPFILELFDNYVELFTRVMSKQFVKDVLELWNVQKKEAHRKDIKISKKKIAVEEPKPGTSGADDSQKQPKGTKRRTGKGKGKAKKKTQQIENPCGICGKECWTDCVACDLCERWFHGDCVKVEDLNTLPEEWYCSQCTESL